MSLKLYIFKTEKELIFSKNLEFSKIIQKLKDEINNPEAFSKEMKFKTNKIERIFTKY